MPNQWPINEEFPSYVDLSKVNIRFAADRMLRELKGSKKLREKQVFEFRMSCKAFLITMVKKLVERSFLTYPLVRYMNFLDPRIFIAKKETSAEKLTRFLCIIERLRFTFTSNGRREFVPRDQVFALFSVYSLLLLHKNK